MKRRTDIDQPTITVPLTDFRQLKISAISDEGLRFPVSIFHDDDGRLAIIINMTNHKSNPSMGPCPIVWPEGTPPDSVVNVLSEHPDNTTKWVCWNCRPGNIPAKQLFDETPPFSTGDRVRITREKILNIPLKKDGDQFVEGECLKLQMKGLMGTVSESWPDQSIVVLDEKYPYSENGISFPFSNNVFEKVS